MNRRVSDTSVSLAAAASMISALTTLNLCVTGCAERDDAPAVASPSAPGAAAAPAASSRAGRVLPLRDGERPLLQPIHSGVGISLAEGGAVVEYTRSRGKPFGVAYMLEPDTLADHQALVLDILSEPVQRLQLCLTDAQGIVWNAPATLEQTPGRLRFDLSRLQPDPFQNRGRTLPAAAAEPSSMRMLTVLDISGFMGAPEVPCRWTIGRIELTEGLDPTRTATTGGAR